jgi:hypothetical protein
MTTALALSKDPIAARQTAANATIVVFTGSAQHY